MSHTQFIHSPTSTQSFLWKKNAGVLTVRECLRRGISPVGKASRLLYNLPFDLNIFEEKWLK